MVSPAAAWTEPGADATHPEPSPPEHQHCPGTQRPSGGPLLLRGARSARSPCVPRGVTVRPPALNEVMATQTTLLAPAPRRSAFHLDPRSREAGRKGLAKARAALADTVARTQADRRVEAGEQHAHAA